MNDKRLPEAIIGRLSRVRSLESQLVDGLEELRTDTAIDRAPGEVSRACWHSRRVTD